MSRSAAMPGHERQRGRAQPCLLAQQSLRPSTCPRPRKPDCAPVPPTGYLSGPEM